MNEGSGPMRISLRQADGEFFPVFRHGDPDTRNLSLVPATEGQDEADIQFFHHPADGSRPARLGTIRFPNLPSESEENELFLDAVIGATGLLSVTVRHRESGRVERLEMEIPDEVVPAASREASSGSWRHGSFRWILGVLFVALGLGAIAYLTLMITEWGREEPLSAPLSTQGMEDPSSAV